MYKHSSPLPWEAAGCFGGKCKLPVGVRGGREGGGWKRRGKESKQATKVPKRSHYSSGYGFKLSIFSNCCFPGLKWVNSTHIIMKYFNIYIWNIYTYTQLSNYVYIELLVFLNYSCQFPLFPFCFFLNWGGGRRTREDNYFTWINK